jgi:hypothetical protein
MRIPAVALLPGLAMAGGASAAGSHFVFIDPCPPETAARVPALCQDAPGDNRVAIQRQIEGEISDFLCRSL